MAQADGATQKERGTETKEGVEEMRERLSKRVPSSFLLDKAEDLYDICYEPCAYRSAFVVIINVTIGSIVVTTLLLFCLYTCVHVSLSLSPSLMKEQKADRKAREKEGHDKKRTKSVAQDSITDYQETVEPKPLSICESNR